MYSVASIRRFSQSPFFLGKLPDTALLEELGDQAGPSGLVAGAEAFAGVAVEVLVEERVLSQFAFAESGSGEEERREALREFAGSVAQGNALAGAGRKINLQGIAVVVAEALQR